MDLAERMQKMEGNVARLRQDTAIIGERQDRMHSDMTKLGESIERLTVTLDRMNSFIDNKRGFVAGAVVTISVLVSLIGGMVVFVWDKLTG